ncbi:9830_t:CDS:2, partial [Scutellospora calospora]
KSNYARKELLYQIKLYRTREKPFDILYSNSETPLIWWFSLEDSFSKVDEYLNEDEDYIEITEIDLIEEVDENIELEENDNLTIQNILNLDKFYDELDEIEFSMDDEYDDNNSEKSNSLTSQLEEDIDWDPIAEVDKLIEDI